MHLSAVGTPAGGEVAQARPNRSPRIAVVEDDPALREMLASYFVAHGVDLTAMASAEEMFDHVAQQLPDLIVLDIALPGMSGLEACQRLRGRGDPVAIILLTARTDALDRILGLELGADDYVDKPFSARELLARTRAVLRRGSFSPPGPQPPATAPVRIGDWRFVAESHCLHRGHEVRVLNTVEYALLIELTAMPGRAVTRERLFEVSSTNREAALLRGVDAAILRLRRLLEPDPSNPRYIQTVRLQGYMFVPDPAAAFA